MHFSNVAAMKPCRFTDNHEYVGGICPVVSEAPPLGWSAQGHSPQPWPDSQTATGRSEITRRPSPIPSGALECQEQLMHCGTTTPGSPNSLAPSLIANGLSQVCAPSGPITTS